MLIRYKSARSDHDAGLIPLINVVFLLLVFFMLAGYISAREPVEILPPVAGSGPLDEVPSSKLSIDSSGRIFLDNRLSNLEAAITSISERRQQGTTDAVIIRVDERLAFAELKGVLQALRQAGVSNVQLETRPRST